jgi:hypothetical protein
LPPPIVKVLEGIFRFLNGSSGACYDNCMDRTEYDHILIREATILVRVPEGIREITEDYMPEFFDVRTGAPLKQIYPALQAAELQRGYLLRKSHAAALIKCGAPICCGPSVDASKVVAMYEMKQRKLDQVVADSILDRVRLLVSLLKEFLDVADTAQKEEKFWLSQQVLSLLGKFSGRELAEIEEIVEWFKCRRKK